MRSAFTFLLDHGYLVIAVVSLVDQFGIQSKGFSCTYGWSASFTKKCAVSSP
jgi:hypothetical protein